MALSWHTIIAVFTGNALHNKNINMLWVFINYLDLRIAFHVGFMSNLSKLLIIVKKEQLCSRKLESHAMWIQVLPSRVQTKYTEISYQVFYTSYLTEQHLKLPTTAISSCKDQNMVMYLFYFKNICTLYTLLY